MTFAEFLDKQGFVLCKKVNDLHVPMSREEFGALEDAWWIFEFTGVDPFGGEDVPKTTVQQS